MSDSETPGQIAAKLTGPMRAVLRGRVPAPPMTVRYLFKRGLVQESITYPVLTERGQEVLSIIGLGDEA